MTRGCASGAQRYTAPFSRIRVKAGATAPFVDSTFGKLWAADFGYLGGSIYTGRATLDPMIQRADGDWHAGIPIQCDQ